jgi:hypothetical protein
VRIGDVQTGLSKDFILNNMRTHIHEADGVSSDSYASCADTCIICQVFLLYFLEYMFIGFANNDSCFFSIYV